MSKLCSHSNRLFTFREVLERLTVQRQQEQSQAPTIIKPMPKALFPLFIASTLLFVFFPVSLDQLPLLTPHTVLLACPYPCLLRLTIYTGLFYNLSSPCLECTYLLLHDSWACITLKPFLKTSDQTIHGSSNLYSTVLEKLLIHKCQLLESCPKQSVLWVSGKAGKQGEERT